MKRIGLFGGSFNPIHLGHLALAKAICDSEMLDELWFMVSPQNPFKVNMTLLDDNKRLEMVKLAVEGNDKLVACDFEFEMPRPSYTYHTLNALRKVYPDCQFELIIGADNWFKFTHWYKHEEIAAQTPIIIYPRTGFSIDETTLPQSTKLVEAPLFPFSSTDVREAISKGEDASNLVPEPVWDLIKKEHLYEYNS